GGVAAAVVHADRVRRHDGGPDQADPGVYGADPVVRAPAVLPVRRAVPAERTAGLADRADEDRSDHLRRRPDAAGGVRAPRVRPRVAPAGARDHVVALGGAALALAR